MAVAPRTQFGPYEIGQPIGAGGMGEVYKARDTRLRRDVAIKVLKLTDPTAWGRFQREARVAASLSHPNICSVHDVGEADGQPYLVMEFLEGVTLKAHIGGNPLKTDEALAIAVQIADALEAAHAKGVIHRDIKPANVMLIGHGHVKVLDFGLARQIQISEEQETLTLASLSALGVVMGTPQYLSPEVLQGSEADARSDLWAFGVVLHQMLSGRLPFTGTTMLEISSSILKEPVPQLPASVPAVLRVIVDRCLKKNPEERFQSASELHAALQAVRAPKSNRHSWFWAAGVAAVLVAIGLFWWQQRPDGRARLSTGGPPSSVQEANELFERAMVLQRVQSNIPKSQALLEQALQLDSHFAEARRFHAFEYVLSLLNGYTNDSGVLNKADEELRLVARENPDLESLPSAQAILYLAMGRKDLIPFEKLNRGIEADPGNTTNRNARMLLLVYAEENEAARQEALRILELERTHANARGQLADIMRRQGDVQGAIRELTRVLESGPLNIGSIRRLALAYIDAGDTGRARELLEEKKAQLSNNYLWRIVWALLLAAEGKREDALQTMDAETLKYAAASYTATSEAAEVYAVLGDTAKAVELIRQAVRNGDERVDWFRKNPRLTSIQKNQDFLRIVASVEAQRKR
jgi:serine/threonine protein kinase/Tfp pilus assembly protein PilF